MTQAWSHSQVGFLEFLDAAPDALMVHAEDGTILLANAQLEALFGYDHHELLGKPVEVLFPVRFRERHLHHRAHYSAQPARRPMGVGPDLYGLRKDGTEFAVEVGLSPLQSTEGPIIISTMRDITDRKRAEASQQLLIDVTTAMAEAGLDLQVIFTVVTRQLAEYMGDACTAQILSETGEPRGPAVTAHRDPVAQALLEQAIANVSTEWMAMHPNALQGGECVLLTSSEAIAQRAPSLQPYLDHVGLSSMLIAPLRGQSRLLGLLTLCRTQSPYTSQDQRFLEDMAHRLALAVQNAQLHQVAEAAILSRDELIESMSHDLAGPITRIELQGEDLSERLASPPLRELTRLREGLVRIQLAEDRLTTLVEELRDVVELQRGRVLHLDRQLANLATLVEAAVRLEQSLDTNHQFQLEVRATELEGNWDQRRLQRAIVNLLDNAIKYSPPGSPITVSVDIETTPANTWGIVEICDQGIGIPADELARIFEPFYRGRNAQGYRPGSGLGLAGASRTVEQHGGSIQVQSEEGQGACFTLRLPFH